MIGIGTSFLSLIVACSCKQCVTGRNTGLPGKSLGCGCEDIARPKPGNLEMGFHDILNFQSGLSGTTTLMMMMRSDDAHLG